MVVKTGKSSLLRKLFYQKYVKRRGIYVLFKPLALQFKPLDNLEEKVV